MQLFAQSKDNPLHPFDRNIPQRLEKIEQEYSLKNPKNNADAIKMLEMLRKRKNIEFENFPNEMMTNLFINLLSSKASVKNGKTVINIYWDGNLMATYDPKDNKTPVILQEGSDYYKPVFILDKTFSLRISNGHLVIFFINSDRVIPNSRPIQIKGRFKNSDDRAQINGGIDLNSANLAMMIKRDGRGIVLPLNQQDMAQLSNIKGLDPIILSIKPASETPEFSKL